MSSLRWCYRLRKGFAASLAHALSRGRCGAFGLSAVLVAKNARDAQSWEGSIGYPGTVGRQMRFSRLVSPHLEPDSAPVHVLPAQRSIFCPLRGLLPSAMPSKGRVHRARPALRRSRVRQSAGGKCARRTRDVGRTRTMIRANRWWVEGRCCELTSTTCSHPLAIRQPEPATCSLAKPITSE